MAFITYKQFNELVSSNAPVKTWKELEEKKIFKVTGRKLVAINDEPSMILSLVDNKGNSCSVWVPKRLREQLQTEYADESVTLYVRSNGKKECKSDPERWYYDYEIATVN